MTDKKKTKFTIGVVVSELVDYYQQSIFEGIKYQANKENIRILCFMAGALEFKQRTLQDRNSVLELINKDNIDILLLMSGALSIKSGIQGIQRLITKVGDLPVVSIGIKVPDIPSIIVDNFKGFYDLINHLINFHKKKSIGFMKGPDANEEAIIRFKAYKQALKDNNIEFNEDLITEGNFDPGDGTKGVKILIDKKNMDMDALVCSDDFAAIEAMQALASRGYVVPDDIAVCGFDDIDRSHNCIPTLTTVRQPLFDLGSVAVEFSTKIINKEDVPRVKEIETQFIIRESCGCLLKNILYSERKKTKKDKLSGAELAKKLEKASEDIVAKYNISYFKKSNYEYLEKYLSEICSAIVESFEKKNENILRTVIEKIALKSYNYDLNASFWSSVIRSLFSEIEIPSLSEEDQGILRLLVNTSIAELYIVEKRFLSFEHQDQHVIYQYMNRMGEKILTSFKRKELKLVLKKDLDSIRVTNCFLSLYKDSIETAEIFFYKGPGSQRDLEGQVYPSKLLFPDITKEEKDSSFVILPIGAQNRNFGFMLIKISNFPEMIYEFLAEKVSSGLKSIELMEKMDNYTDHLEKEVKKRTKELQQANKKLRDQSLRDQLSGLHNRRFLMEIVLPQANKLLNGFMISKKYGNRRANKEDNNSFAVIMIDLDHFKDVNDTYGHDSGDMVLCDLAIIFKKCVRDDDFVIRMGGEEFLLVMREFNPKFIDSKVEHIRKTVENNVFKIENDVEIKKTCSLGAIAFPVNDKRPEIISFLSAVSIADKCLYHAKNNGRNQGIIVDIKLEKFNRNNDISEIIINHFDVCIKEKKIVLRKAEDNV